MRKDIINALPHNLTLMTPARGDTAPLISQYSKTNLAVSKIIKRWSEITNAMTNEYNKSNMMHILKNLQSMHFDINELALKYELHPSLKLIIDMLSLLNAHDEANSKPYDKQVHGEQFNKHVLALVAELKSTKHRMTSANFDRLFRRKRECIHEWLVCNGMSTQCVFIEVMFYPPFKIPCDTSLLKSATSFKKMMHRIRKQSLALRGFEEYAWQLQYDDGVGYYYHLLLAIPPDSNMDVLRKRLACQWEAAWLSTTGDQQAPSLSMQTKGGISLLSEIDNQAKINKITEEFCALDSIIKLRVPRGMKTFHHSKTPSI